MAGLPGTMRPGPARLHLAAVARGDSVPGWSSWTYFRVEDFRRPDYEVTGELDQGPWLAGGSMEALATARYYDGAALPGSPVEWRVRSGPTWWSPPGWSGWSFGAWDGGRGRAVEGAWSLEGRTDARGRHALRIGTGALALPFPVAIDVEAQVRDLDRQAGSVRLGAVVHPARRTAGIRTDRIWVRAGEELGFDVVVVDLDGAPVVGAAPVVRALLEPDSTRVGSRGVEEPAPVSCTRGDEERVAGRPVMPLRCGLRPPAPGAYRLEAEVVDARGRRSVTEVRRWVLTSTDPWVSAAPEGELVLTPDRERYRPGDTARIMIVAPFYPLEGLLTVVHHGIRGVEPLRIEGPGRVVRLPIHEEDAGGLEVRVDVSGSVGGHDGFSVRRELAVELGSRRLQVDVTPDRDVVRPGDSVVVEVAVRDADGRPAGGQVALWLVDEAILSLGGYRLGDPLESLHRFRYDSRRGVFLPQRAVRWMRRPLGPGLVSAELLDATTGSPASVLRVSVDGADRGWVQRGNLLLRDVPAGTHRLVLSRGGEPVLERTVDVPGGGLDLGTLLLGEGGERLELRIRGASGRLDALTVAAGTFEANMSPGELARLATPMAPTPTGPPVVLRRLFRALAAFEPAAELDGRGKARITVRLPDTMTRYRIMAVASQGATHFGTAEGAVTARRGLTLRASPPRFLHPGDRPELPLIVQNASDETVDAEVVARASGMELEGDRGFRVRLPAGGRTELRFPARVVRTGSADFEALAVAAVPGGERTDGMGVAVPVSPALAPGAVAVHRRLTAGDSLRLVVETPAGAYPGFGGVEVGLSTTLLQPLVEVLRSLCLQPLYWPEPTIARVLGMAALDGELESLRATDLPSPEELRARTEVDVERLVAWLRPYVYTPAAAGPERGFLSGLELVHGVHAIAVAADAGYPAAGEAVRSMGLLVRRVWKEELDREVAAQRAPTGWERATAAYALHVGMRLDAIGPGPEVALWMKELEPADLPVEALAWLLGPAAQVADSAVLRARWFRELENRALTTGATATFRQGGRVSVGSAEGDLDRLVLASDRRADAAVLAVLVEEAPDHPLVPGLVRGLLGQRDGSAAAGAHENGWVLLALGRYAAMHEAEAAELAVRTRLGGRPLGGEVRLGAAGRTGSDTVLTGPLPVPGRPISLEVTSEGQGTLYVRAGLRFAPVVSPDAPAEDQGFLVSRRYESVDEASDVRRGEDGVWRIRAGARVRVRVTFTAPARRYRVQLLDPLPAGLEAVNPRLRGTGFADDPEPPTRLEPPPGRVSAPLAASLSNFPWGWDLTDTLFRWRAWQGVWATHEELRDDRLEAYTPWLPAGTYQSTWLVRATTPGTFLAPPPRVEETEHPETFGQGRADRVVVEAGPIGWRVAPGG
ncbi:MAG TPA: alpha-2-macroglobulin family protein [Longimicrobiales bacterium]|nr:alpha-2-macroglobulin family protein [Longimicrobiales bacterium]